MHTGSSAAKCGIRVSERCGVQGDHSLPARAAVGALIVTMVEFAAGMLVNRQYEVWDYRDQPLNFMGQICPLFTALWLPLALFAAVLFQKMDEGLDQKMSPD